MRTGRLNQTVVLSDEVQKTCLVKETSRPRKLAVEAWAMKCAKDLGINAPRLLEYGLDSDGREFIRMERVVGRVPTSVSDQACALAMSRVGEMLNAQASAVSGFGWVDPLILSGCYASWTEFLLSNIHKYGTRLLLESVMSEADLASVASRVEISTRGVDRRCLVHRDVKPQNLVLGDDVCLLDWENVIIGDPLFDLAVCEARFGDCRVVRGLANGFGSIDRDLLQAYTIATLVMLVDFCLEFGWPIKGKLDRLSQLLD